MNIWDYIITGAVICIVLNAVRIIIKNKKTGKCSCGCCTGCGSRCSDRMEKKVL